MLYRTEGEIKKKKSRKTHSNYLSPLRSRLIFHSHRTSCRVSGFVLVCSVKNKLHKIVCDFSISKLSPSTEELFKKDNFNIPCEMNKHGKGVKGKFSSVVEWVQSLFSVLRTLKGMSIGTYILLQICWWTASEESYSPQHLWWATLSVQKSTCLFT